LAGLDGDKTPFLAMLQSETGGWEENKFWEDVWLPEGSLAKTFPMLYSVSMNQKVSVRDVFEVGVLIFALEEQW
jgi:hypothetical protein